MFQTAHIMDAKLNWRLAYMNNDSYGKCLERYNKRKPGLEVDHHEISLISGGKCDCVCIDQGDRGYTRIIIGRIGIIKIKTGLLNLNQDSEAEQCKYLCLEHQYYQCYGDAMRPTRST